MRTLTRFGNPILRKPTQTLSLKEIQSTKVQKFITELKEAGRSKKYGVGLAAPQVGESLAVAVVNIKPTDLRPHLISFSLTMINPSYKGIGQRRSKWEGCLSAGNGKNTLYGKALRYSKINATWADEQGKVCKKVLTGLAAHVFQHETDHLNGILFVDHVRDTTSYMMADEYRKRIMKSKEGV